MKTNQLTTLSVFLIILSLTLSMKSSAQEQVGYNKFQLGFNMGYDKINYKNPFDYYTLDYGITSSLSASYYFHKNLGIYAGYGFQLIKPTTSLPSNIISSAQDVNIPIVHEYNLLQSHFFNLGIEISLLPQAKKFNFQLTPKIGINYNNGGELISYANDQSGNKEFHMQFGGFSGNSLYYELSTTLRYSLTQKFSIKLSPYYRNTSSIKTDQQFDIRSIGQRNYTYIASIFEINQEQFILQNDDPKIINSSPSTSLQTLGLQVGFSYHFGKSQINNPKSNISIVKSNSIEVTKQSTQPKSTPFLGWCVTTKHGWNNNDNVGEIFDTRVKTDWLTGKDWGKSINRIQPPNWTKGEIGQIFGLAHDNDHNIYLASSDLYYTLFKDEYDITSDNKNRPFSAGQIFKAEPPTYEAIPFCVIPISNEPELGIGNIVFDKYHNQLFASNVENGMLYRINIYGEIVEKYDPWEKYVTSEKIVRDEIIYALAINKEDTEVKLYFTRIGNDRSLYSITLKEGKFPKPKSEILEIQEIEGESIITDLAFSSDNKELLMSEAGNIYNSRTISYSALKGNWLKNRTYNIGTTRLLTAEYSSAGGVSFFYDLKNDQKKPINEYLIASANSMSIRSLKYSKKRLTGLQILSYNGNNPSTEYPPLANQDTDHFIDFDGKYKDKEKPQLIDVEILGCINCESINN